MKTRTSNSVVSIIVRTVNRPHFLKEAMESLRQQTYRPLEIVLVNDVPEAVPAECLDSGEGFNVKLVHLTTSRGRSAAANAGLQNAEGIYLGFLDDDDVFYPDHVERTAGVLDSNPAVGAVYADLHASSQERCAASPSGYKTVGREVRYCRPFDREFLFLDNYIPINAVLFRRECIDRIGYFDEDMEVLEDWDFWIRMALEYDMVHLCAVTGEFRIRTDESNSTHRLQELFPSTRNYVHRKYAERVLPLLYKRLRAGFPKQEVTSVGNGGDTQDRMAHLQWVLREKERELEELRFRLRRYLNFAPIKVARLLRRKLLGLPPPLPDP